MKFLAPSAVLLAGLALALAADRVTTDADVVIAHSTDVFTLDPQRMSYLKDFRLAYALYEGLVRWDNETFEVRPAAAAALPTVSDDQRVYTFTLRDDAQWSNGAPVTAHDFSYAWQRLLLPETAADYSNLFFCIDGAEAFWRWRAEQLARFTADPWAVQGPARPAAVQRMIARIDALLDDAHRPDAIAIGRSFDVDAYRAERERLLAAAAGHRFDPDAALADATVCRQLLDRLNRPASRAAEVRRMWRRAQQRFAETVGIEPVDDRTLRITLARPVPYFLDLVCFAVCCPVYRPAVEGWMLDEPLHARTVRDGWHAVEPPPFRQRRWVRLDPATGRFEQRHDWARPGRLVSNGPYVLTAWRYQRDLRLDRNDLYHSPGMLRNDSVVAVVIADANTRVLAFETGQVHWVSTVEAEYQSDLLAQRRAYERRHAARLADLRAQGRSVDEALALLPEPRPGARRDVHAIPAFGTDFFSFNCRETLGDGRVNPFADAAVRRAFALATDKGAIVESATRLGEPIADTLVPRGSVTGYDSPDGLPFDIDRARRELRAAGWSDRDSDGLVEDAAGLPFPTVDLLYTTNTPRYEWMALELKSQWEANLGVRVELRGADTKFYKEDLRQGNFMVARGRWYGDYGDPTTFLNLCRSTDGNNDRGFVSAEIDALLDQAAAETDPDQRLALLAQCERRLMTEHLPLLPICQLVEVSLYDPAHLRGLTRHPRLVQYLWQLHVTREAMRE